MPTMDRSKIGDGQRTVISTTTTVGPAVYATGVGRPTVTIPYVRTIESINDVRMWAAQGFLVMPVSVAGNVVRYSVMQAGNAHAHDMRIVQNGAAAMKINIAANAFEAQVGADVVVLGGVATGGMAKAATIAKANVADMGAIEVPDGTDLSATGQNLSIYATVVGLV